MYNMTNNNENELNFFDEMANFLSDNFKPVVKNMKTDIVEHDNDYEFSIDMPGFDKKDIKIEVKDEYLTVSASKEATENKENKKNYVRRERSFRSVSRSYYVGDVDEHAVKAKLENGILSIVVPKAKQEKEETKYISIE